MDKPIYEIPVTSPGSSGHGWIPGISLPPGDDDIVDDTDLAMFDPFEALGLSPEPSTPVVPVAATSLLHTAAAPALPTPLWAAPAPTALAGNVPGLATPGEPQLRRERTRADRFAATPTEPESGGNGVDRSAPVETPRPAASAPSAATAPAAASAASAPLSERPRADRTLRPEGPDPELIEALATVVERDASDLHITVGAPPSIRIDGSLRPIEGAEQWMGERVTTALRSLLSAAQLEEYERELELDFAYTAANARFRVNYYQQRGSMGAAFRLIPREIKQLKELGVPDSVAHFATLPRGLVLVTGPTGSGKSTTLAALIDLVNRTRNDHIVTVEDPIEFLHTHQKSLVNQREVGSDTHSFASALKHVLRQDPDVILVGELRDLETVSVALTAAETGHLVFATLHTQDAAQTIDRVIDVFPPHQQAQVRSQLASTLQGVVCQTLVKKASGSGRVVATEVMIATPAVNNLIREGKTHQIPSAMQAGRDLGMHTMDQHLAELVNTGKITRQAAEEKTQDAASLKQLIHRTESPSDTVHDLDDSIDFGDAFSGGRTP